MQITHLAHRVYGGSVVIALSLLVQHAVAHEGDHGEAEEERATEHGRVQYQAFVVERVNLTVRHEQGLGWATCCGRHP